MNATKRSFVFLAFLSSLALSNLSAIAQVTFFGVQKTQFYTQTADNTAPTTPDSFSVFAFANTSSATDADSFTVHAAGTDTLSLVNSTGSPTSFAGSAFYASKSDMDTGFPSGNTYTFTANGGTLDGESDSLPIGSDDYPPLAYVTGTGISDALGLNPDFGYTFDFGYTGTGTSTATSFAIFDPSGNFIYDAGGVSLQGTYFLDASFLQTLTPGLSYTAQITDFNTSGSLTTGDFINASNSDGFTQSTLFTLGVAPEPTDFLFLSLGAIALTTLLRRSLRLHQR